MQIIILAAGKGERLQTQGISKPLVTVLGIPLLEHNLRQSIALQPSEILIVTGHEHLAVEQWLTRWLAQQPTTPPLPTIRCLYNEQWSLFDNGYSLRTAAPHIQRPFLLLMADHLYSADLLQALCQQPLGENSAYLAVDRRLNRHEIDLDDATKVEVNPQGLIVSLSKNLSHYNGIDCGAFFCSPEVARRCLQLNPDNCNRLSQIMMHLTTEGLLKAFMHHYYWQDIDTPTDRNRAEKALLRLASQKSHDGPIARWINRFFSQRFSLYFIRWRLSPNIISFLSFFIALIGAFCIAQPSYFWLAFGGFLTQLASIIDGSDGEVARAQYRSSDYGGWFDALLDRYADIAILAAMTWHAMHTHGIAWMWLGISAIAGSFISSYSAHKADRMQGFRLIRIGRDLRCFIVFITTLVAQPLLGLWIISILMNLTVLYRIFLLYPQSSSQTALENSVNPRAQ
ncbi:MAG TPA: NTP transferase domain-containing protein [Burkholderiaceae bacterium]|nr:NTP transferase domain-containing protein [Burkholderiaceae bacterium]